MTCEVLRYNVGSTTELKFVLIDEFDAFINDATALVTLIDSDGVEVGGETWPITADYIAASDGQYLSELVATLDMSANIEYKAIITASRPNGKQGRFIRKIIAQDG